MYYNVLCVNNLAVTKKWVGDMGHQESITWCRFNEKTGDDFSLSNIAFRQKSYKVDKDLNVLE